MKDLISVIVPVYNTEKYLPKCIESIINQTYTNLEIILIDDGSTDNSGKICNEYAEKDSRIIVIHKENEGVSSARNSALDIMKGSYILFVDSDDYIEPNMCEVLYRNIIDTGAEMACCNIKMITDISASLYCDKNIDTLFSAEEAACELCKCTLLNPGIACKLLKTDAVGNLRMRKKIFIGEDMLFMYEAMQNMNRVHYTSIPLYNCYIRNGSAYHNGFNHRIFTEQTSFKIMLEIAEKNMPCSIPFIKCHIVTAYMGMVFRVWKNPEQSEKTQNLYLKIFQKNIRKNLNLFDVIRINGRKHIKSSILVIIFSTSIVLFKTVVNMYTYLNCRGRN